MSLMQGTNGVTCVISVAIQGLTENNCIGYPHSTMCVDEGRPLISQKLRGGCESSARMQRHGHDGREAREAHSASSGGSLGRILVTDLLQLVEAADAWISASVVFIQRRSGRADGLEHPS